MTRRRKKYKIGKKGTIFWDEGAPKTLIKPTQEVGFEVKQLPKSYRNCGFGDSGVSKIAKGKPMVTDDYTAYDDSGRSSGATAYIIPESVSKKDFPGYVLVWKNFLRPHTTRTLAGYIWKVHFKKTVEQEELS